MYVVNDGNSTVTAYDAATGTVAATINVGGGDNGVAAAQDGRTVYVTNSADNTVSVISTASNTVTATIPVGSFPFDMAVGRDGTSAYVANDGDNTVSVISTATGAVTGTISGFSFPQGVATANVPSAAPAVTGVSPGFGPQAGGTQVTISGSGFTGATAVHFGATAASAFTVTSDTQITATAPAAASLGPVDVTVTTPAGTSAISPAGTYRYVNETGRVTAAGRVTVGGNDAEFGFAARDTQAGGPVKGHLEYENQAAGVHIDQAAFTVFYLTSTTTAHAEGTARCTIRGTTGTCPITVTATDAGDAAEHDDASIHPDKFTLTYNTTTVGGTVEDGHVEVAPEPGGSTAVGARALRPAALAAQPVDAAPAAAAMTGSFSASLLGISLSGGRCGTAALVFTDGTAAGDLSCLLLGIAGINIDLNLRLASGTAGTGTSTVSGTATITVAGLLPVSLPATVVLTTSGTTAGLRLTVAGITLPVLPIGTGGIQLG